MKGEGIIWQEDFSLTFTPNSISFFTVFMSPFTIEAQNGLTVGDETTSMLLEKFKVLLACAYPKDTPNAIAKITAVFFMMKEFKLIDCFNFDYTKETIFFLVCYTSKNLITFF